MGGLMTLEHVNPTSAHAHMLVKALENVILPIVHACLPGLATNRSTPSEYEYKAGSGSRLDPEAQQLVSALENFVNMLIRPQVVQHSGRTERKEGVTPRRYAQLAVVPIPQCKEISLCKPPTGMKVLVRFNSVRSEKPPILKQALEKLRYRVFNKMPIRLLAFKPDGSDVELIERSTIFDRMSLAMETDFYRAHTPSALRLLKAADHEDTTAEEHQAKENQVIDDVISQYAKYTILSHTWLRDAPGEVTYAVWKARGFDRDSAGYKKLANFCRIAATEHGITLGWMDTICINKESSAELDESIRSMYIWYADASICITHLAQTTALPHMRNDPWFTRGWTLQELLAPPSIKFYGANWQQLPTEFDHGSKHYLMEDEIFIATSIKQAHRLSFRRHRHNIPISERMEWAANRQVTREEDVAYSLMGIFDVSLSIAYGEGSERAFIRLLKEIMNLSGRSAFDILNGGSAVNTSSAIPSYLPSSPKQYLKRSSSEVYWPTPRIPFTLTHLGLRVSILLMPAISVNRYTPDSDWSTIGDFYARADVDLLGFSSAVEATRFPGRYNILDAANNSCVDSNGWDALGSRFRIIFGLLNFIEDDGHVCLPCNGRSSALAISPGLPTHQIRRSYGFALCFIMLLGSKEPQRLPTSAPVTLDIKTHSARYTVRKSELGEHGIELRTLYC